MPLTLNSKEFTRAMGIDTNLLENKKSVCNHPSMIGVPNCGTKVEKAVERAVICASEPAIDFVHLKIKKSGSNVHIFPKSTWENSLKELSDVVDGLVGIAPHPKKSQLEVFRQIHGNKSDTEIVKANLSNLKYIPEVYNVGFSTPNERFESCLNWELDPANF